MNRTTHWLVADYGVRPAGPPDRCFYCDMPMGQEHKEGCVIRQRTVVIRYQIDLVVAVPEDWNPDMINFRYNESTWCAEQSRRGHRQNCGAHGRGYRRMPMPDGGGAVYARGDRG